MDAKVKMFLENSLVVGVAAGASVVATDWLLDNYSESVGTRRALMQAGGHAALGFGIAYMGLPRVGAGVAVGGVVSAVETFAEWSSLDDDQREALRLAQRARIEARRRGDNTDDRPGRSSSSSGSGSSGSGSSGSGSSGSGSSSSGSSGSGGTGSLGYGDAWSRYELPAYAYAMD